MQLLDDRAEWTRREQSGPQRAGRVLADRRQQPQSCSHRCRHVIELPANLRFTGGPLVGCGQTGGLRGVRGGAESMSAYVRDGRSLPGRSGGSRGRGGVSLVYWDATLEATTDPLGGAKLATCECPCPSDQFTRTAIAWSGRLGTRGPRSVMCADVRAIDVVLIR